MPECDTERRKKGRGGSGGLPISLNSEFSAEKEKVVSICLWWLIIAAVEEAFHCYMVHVLPLQSTCKRWYHSQKWLTILINGGRNY